MPVGFVVALCVALLNLIIGPYVTTYIVLNIRILLLNSGFHQLCTLIKHGIGLNNQSAGAFRTPRVMGDSAVPNMPWFDNFYFLRHFSRPKMCAVQLMKKSRVEKSCQNWF